ncbi:ribose 5-phosphate isomerase B [bacterium]|jgi:ribose 5-phosphate isomerase B|nr:ribose 5-phosphate isomerase B [bacterium]
MKVAVGSDHRGFQVKKRVMKHLADRNHEVLDLGTNSEESVDYPDYAQKVCLAVARKQADRGVLICGTGIGMCIVANKYDGIRAAPAHDDVTAELSRSHNDANVLCLSADLLGGPLIDHILDIWMKTQFDGGRHQRRVDKIHDAEKMSS